MDWTDIEAKLGERAEDVCRHLFPNGKRDGAEFVVGSLSGEAGHSLKVNLTGKVGVWKDFAGDSGGKTLMSLWMQARQLPKFGLAMKEAKEFLGIADDFQRRVKPFHPIPSERPDDSSWQAITEVWKRCVPLALEHPQYRYLVEQRKLDPAILEIFDVRGCLSNGKPVMVFPYFAAPADELPALLKEPLPEWMKFELLERPGGKKREWTSKAPEKSLFGIQLARHAVFKNCRHALISEGEKDALAWASLGCHQWSVLPLSVPFGAKWRGQDKNRPSPNREWLDRSWDWLQQFETVFVQMDGDEAGQRAAADIITEIGPRRCRLVVLPDGVKDANECLMKGVAPELMKSALDSARDFAPQKVRSAAELEDDFLKWVFEREVESGVELPFDFPLRLRRKETTVWMGVKGCGKSTLLDFVTVAALAQGERALVASFEMPWEDTHDKLCRQAFGGLYFDKRMLKKCETDEQRENVRAASRAQTIETHRWLAKSLWYYVHVGIAHWRQLIDDMRWARRRLGITWFVVDNFMRLGISKDDYAQQADAMIALAGLAMELDAHIIIVVHSTKETAKKSRNDGYGNAASVSGAHEIGDNAHNIVEIQRDDKKGKQVNELFDERKVGTIGEDEFKQKKSALDLKPDGRFIMHNQRKGEVQDGSKHLWFLWESQQYVDVPAGHRDHQPLRFVASAKQTANQNDLPTNEEMGIER